MNPNVKRWLAVLAGIAWLLLSMESVSTQEAAGGSQQMPPEAGAPQTAAPLTAAQLDQVTAPIALYSDPLLGMILTGATYPLEIVEAARWLDADDHASLKGGALDAALAQESWDASIKALVAVPEALRMMNENLEWTEQLGDAFLSQQADVMDSIQRLRQRAAASGALQSSPQESVSTEDGEVIIEPATPEVIYVPCYTPAIYGPWPWPDYPAYYLPLPAGYCYPGPFISFGIGFGIIGPYWGWGRWNWHGHGFYVAPHRGPGHGHPWYHDPAHRHGVPYRDAATAQRYLGPNGPAWRGYRGFPPTPGRAPARAPAPAPARAPARGVPPAMPRAPAITRPGPPAFESYGSGPRVRAQAARGAFSRAPSAPRGGAPHVSGAHGGGRPH